MGKGVTVASSAGVGSEVGAEPSLHALRTMAIARTVRAARRQIRREATVIWLVSSHVRAAGFATGSGEFERLSIHHVKASRKTGSYGSLAYHTQPQCARIRQKWHTSRPERSAGLPSRRPTPRPRPSRHASDDRRRISLV